MKPFWEISFMQGNILKNFKVILVYLTLLLLLVFIAEKTGKTFFLEYIFKIIIVIYFITSLYLNKNMFINIKTVYF